MRPLTLLAAALVVSFSVSACGAKKTEKSEKADDTSAASSSEPTKKAVLPSIEKFKIPEGPDPEPYDALKLLNDAAAAGVDAPGQRKELPPTLTDVWAQDLRTTAFYDLKLGKLDAKTVTLADIEKIVEFYADADVNKLRGYRPRTHKAFVAAFSVEQRKTLAQESLDYLKANGFKGPDTLASAAPPVAAPLASAISDAAAAPTGEPPATFAGAYSSIWGPVTLKQTKATPNKVRGTYGRGSMDCDASGVKLDCSWRENDGSAGRAAFQRDDKGNLPGTWGAGASAVGGGVWNLTLTKAGDLE